VRKFIYFLIPLIIVSCEEQKKDVLASVDGSAFTKDEFEKILPPSEYMKLSDENLKQLIESWVEQEILYLEAKKRGIEAEDSVSFVLEQYRKRFVATELVRREFGGTSISEVEVREYFDKHKDEFLYGVKLGRIVLANYEIAKRTLDEIRAGADFFKLARERSLTRFENPEDPQIVTTYLPRGQIADFGTEEIIFNMERGEVSEVIPSLGAFWIIKLIDKKKLYAKADYEGHKDAIRDYLYAKRYQQFLFNYVDSLKAEYKVTIDLSPLKQ
jgi:peptidyl-prolyl cis-trans isomerase C